MGFPRITEANRRWWVLATMTGSLSMIMIDQTVVSVALPTMERDLHLSQVGAQWVVNAYMLVLAMLVAVGGRLGDLLGPERLFRIGAAVFVGASALCGLAEGEAWIIGARALQGAGAAVMVPATGSILINAFAPEERGKAMGLYAGTSMVFLALGPLVGGVLTQAISWRAVFYVNLPIGLITVVAAQVTLSRSAAAQASREGSLDWLGSTLLVGALGALVLALMEGQTWGWTSPAVLGLLVATVVIVPLFPPGSVAAASRWCACRCCGGATSPSTTASSPPFSSRSSGCRCSAPSGCRRCSATARSGRPVAAAADPAAAVRRADGRAAG